MKGILGEYKVVGCWLSSPKSHPSPLYRRQIFVPNHVVAKLLGVSAEDEDISSGYYLLWTGVPEVSPEGEELRHLAVL